jgi:hypothetical protein
MTVNILLGHASMYRGSSNLVIDNPQITLLSKLCLEPEYALYAIWGNQKE